MLQFLSSSRLLKRRSESALLMAPWCHCCRLIGGGSEIPNELRGVRTLVVILTSVTSCETQVTSRSRQYRTLVPPPSAFPIITPRVSDWRNERWPRWMESLVVTDVFLLSLCEKVQRNVENPQRPKDEKSSQIGEVHSFLKRSVPLQRLACSSVLTLTEFK